ncbi:uncharacterized protein LOC6738183 [Drosophila simulans]|uniref:GD12544 n=1 Tax=Drosophila simulans TaxID=7240 RepID=B4QL56_DROSI|nr:uncharacterized protein LOC6738183 [Drosophila simulans]EDX10581.1 GD12544 [Drosophila simulans]KMY99806.1 uncharacterized protein Dsimw501_GD12544 [Drosophila simulans]
MKLTLCFLLILGFVIVHGQSNDCKEIKDICTKCIQRLNDPYNKADFINKECRRKVRGSYVWKDQNLCELQAIACSVPTRAMLCVVIAEVAKMPKVTPRPPG